MKIKKFKKSILILLLVLVVVGIIISKAKIVKSNNNSEINIEKYINPINENGIINNEYFGIVEGDNSSKSMQNTIGINEAIDYASKHNISNLKLEKGFYYIEGTPEEDTQEAVNKGICLKSNITLDLNGAILKQIPNNKTNYAIFSILNKENITIKNGVLIGDKQEHIEGNGANDKGFGVDIRGGFNISLDNLYICNLTGDGVLIKEMDSEDGITFQPTNIVIKNCIITNNRRQGISVVSASNVYIHDNEIYNIAGKNPQTCIDIESDGWRKQKNTNINIYNNKLYDSISRLAIFIYTGLYDCKIYNNEITGRILVTDVKDYLYIHNNSIESGGIIINKDYYTDQNEFTVNKIIVRYNEIKNGNIDIKMNDYTIFEKNTLINTLMTITLINFVLSNNYSDMKIDVFHNYSENSKLYNIGNKYQEFNIEQNVENIENENTINEMIQKIMLGVK